VPRACRAVSRPPRHLGDRRPGRAPHGPRGREGPGDQPAPHRHGGFGRRFRRRRRRVQDLLRPDLFQGDAAAARHRAVVAVQSRRACGPRRRAAAAAAHARADAGAAMNSGGALMKVVDALMRSFLLGTIVALAVVPRVGAAPLEAAAENYRHYLIDDIGQALTSARVLRERLAARDLDGARKAWIAARVGWERSEVFTSGFVPELDQQIDAWPNASHGFHGIEATLFGASGADGGAETDALIAHLAELRAQLDHVDL